LIATPSNTKATKEDSKIYSGLSFSKIGNIFLISHLFYYIYSYVSIIIESNVFVCEIIPNKNNEFSYDIGNDIPYADDTHEEKHTRSVD